MVRVRFAPSPTGALHIGGARTALFNYLLARSSSGKFILRVDDTDLERSVPGLEQDIKDGLNWLGLLWDEGPDAAGPYGPYRQSERREIHLRDAQTLLKKNRAYRDAEGVLRLRYPDAEIVVDDMVCGRCVFQPNSLGPEVVLVRSDGSPTYHLASVSDDIEMQISHVVRGQDHLTNTAKHVVIFQGLGQDEPKFAHLPLILGQDGAKLSKRESTGMTTVNEFRQAGYLPEAVVNFLLLLGWSHPESKEQISLEEAISAFVVDRIGKTASVFEISKLNWLNGWWMRHLPVEKIAAALRPFVGEFEPVIVSRGAQYWMKAAEFLRAEIGFLTETSNVAQVLFSREMAWTDTALTRFFQTVTHSEAKSVIKSWIDLLHVTPLEQPGDYFSKEEFAKVTAALKKKVDVDKKVIFLSLRMAIMGNTTGPELQAVVPLVPRDVLLQRACSALCTIEALSQ